MLTAQFTAENVVGKKQSFSVRTGVVQFKADWPGVFIRGVDALNYAATIHTLLRQAKEEAMRARTHPLQFEQWGRLEELAELLESCRIKDGDNRAWQQSRTEMKSERR